MHDLWKFHVSISWETSYPIEESMSEATKDWGILDVLRDRASDLVSCCQILLLCREGSLWLCLVICISCKIWSSAEIITCYDHSHSYFWQPIVCTVDDRSWCRYTAVLLIRLMSLPFVVHVLCRSISPFTCAEGRESYKALVVKNASNNGILHQAQEQSLWPSKLLSNIAHFSKWLSYLFPLLWCIFRLVFCETLTYSPVCLCWENWYHSCLQSSPCRLALMRTWTSL